MNTNMTMSYEFIDPEMAAMLLETNDNNRRISAKTVASYAYDIVHGNWDEQTGVAISIDANGILRDGAHRCEAIVATGKGIWSWVCRNVDADGTYDNNRKRSNVDQITIMRPDYESVYKSTRYISCARTMISQSSRAPVSPKSIMDYTDTHKETLDGFFMNMPQSTIPKISLANVYCALYLAYLQGVDIDDILSFYDILCYGMSTSEVDFPIIAYRNYLLNREAGAHSGTLIEMGRCQYALKKYLTRSCTKRTVAPKELIWNFPKEEQ